MTDNLCLAIAAISTLTLIIYISLMEAKKWNF